MLHKKDMLAEHHGEHAAPGLDHGAQARPATSVPATQRLGLLSLLHTGARLLFRHSRTGELRQPEEEAEWETTQREGKESADKVHADAGTAAKPLMDRIGLMRAQMCWARDDLWTHDDCLKFLDLSCKKFSSGTGICTKFKNAVVEHCKHAHDPAEKESACRIAADMGLELEDDSSAPTEADILKVETAAKAKDEAPAEAPAAPADEPVDAPAKAPVDAPRADVAPADAAAADAVAADVAPVEAVAADAVAEGAEAADARAGGARSPAPMPATAKEAPAAAPAAVTAPVGAAKGKRGDIDGDGVLDASTVTATVTACRTGRTPSPTTPGSGKTATETALETTPIPTEMVTAS